MENIDTRNEMQLEISGEAQRYLRETSMWTNFLGVMAYIGCGFFVLFGIIMIIVGIAAPGMAVSTGLYSPGVIVGMGILYLCLSVFYFFIARYIYNYSKKLKQALISGNPATLTEAFRNEKSLWKLYSIFLISVFVLVFLFVSIAIIIGIASAM